MHTLLNQYNDSGIQQKFKSRQIQYAEQNELGARKLNYENYGNGLI